MTEPHPPDDINSRLEAIKKRFEDEARPKLENYINDKGWKDATIVNRFVIQKGDHYLVQTVSGVQEVVPGRNNQNFAINSTKLDSWLEEDELSKRLREMSGGGGIKISGASVGKISVGNISVGSGVRIDNVGIKDAKDFTFEVPGAKLKTSSASGKINFEISD